MLLIVYQVVQRYVFGPARSRWKRCSGISMASASCSGFRLRGSPERHVRIDVLAEHWSLRRRLWIELFGLAVFLLPFSL